MPYYGGTAQRFANPYAPVANDSGKLITVYGGSRINISDSVYANGDVITLVNGSNSNINLVFSQTLTSYIAGINSDTNYIVLAPRGVASIMFIDTSTCVLSGNFIAYG